MVTAKWTGGQLARAVLGCGLLFSVGVPERARADEQATGGSREPGEPTVGQAIAAGISSTHLRQLLDMARDPLAPDRDGDTALHVAAMVRDPAYLELLLAAGLGPDARNRISGRTPIMSAMLAERDRQFTMLLAAGASVALADATGNTPLHIAAQINKPRHVLALLNAGAPANARNAQGQSFQRYLFMTPSHLLNEETERSRRAVVTWLLRKGIALEADAP